MLKRIREFIDLEVLPVEQEYLGRSFLDALPALNELRQKVKDHGLWLPQIPRQYGGTGLSFMEYALACEQLARSPFGNYCFNAQAPDAGNMEIVS